MSKSGNFTLHLVYNLFVVDTPFFYGNTFKTKHKIRYKFLTTIFYH